ncbi:MAG: stage II sporulation protein P [Betaproteobacteria bacterium]
MRWTKRWRRAWRSWQGRRRHSPEPTLGFAIRPAPPGRSSGWRRLIAVYVFLGLLTGGAIVLVSAPGPALRSAGHRLGSAAWRAVGEVVPATRFLLATDQELGPSLLRTTLPLLRSAPESDRRSWLDRLVEGVTGMDFAAPESFLRQTMIARGGRRGEPRINEIEPELEPGLTSLPPASHGAPEGETPSAEPAERAPETPVPPIQRRTEPELRRFPWGTSPLIAVYHTHSSEAYHGPNGHTKKGRTYSPDDYVWGKTSGTIAVGDELARILTEDYRIPVVHSRNIHDYPIFRDAYANSAVTARQILRKYQGIRFLLDLHRDGLADVDRDFITTVMGGERLARIALIVGRGQPGLPNPHWERNLALAQRLHAKMEEMYPGLSRGVTVRNWSYNQELTDRALLLEIGDHYNTKEEATRSAALLADCLAALLADMTAGTHQPSRVGGR